MAADSREQPGHESSRSRDLGAPWRQSGHSRIPDPAPRHVYMGHGYRRSGTTHGDSGVSSRIGWPPADDGATVLVECISRMGTAGVVQVATELREEEEFFLNSSSSLNSFTIRRPHARGMVPIA